MSELHDHPHDSTANAEVSGDEVHENMSGANAHDHGVQPTSPGTSREHVTAESADHSHHDADSKTPPDKRHDGRSGRSPASATVLLAVSLATLLVVLSAGASTDSLPGRSSVLASSTDGTWQANLSRETAGIADSGYNGWETPRWETAGYIDSTWEIPGWQTVGNTDNASKTSRWQSVRNDDIAWENPGWQTVSNNDNAWTARNDDSTWETWRWETAGNADSTWNTSWEVASFVGRTAPSGWRTT